MDRQGFRLKGEPDVVQQPTRYRVKQETQREIDATKTCTAPDNRFRGYAAMLEDGRLLTDYRQSCVTRAPPGEQFAVKNWMVHNTDEILRITRDRQVQNTGHALGTAETEVPGAFFQQCTPYGCEFYPSGATGGIGLERSERTPDLFGTFDFKPNMNTRRRNQEFTSLNNVVEYGRNTPLRWKNLYQ
jgi:hypothetical protein